MAAVLAAPGAIDQAQHTIGSIADSAGLTAQDDYLGWVALLVIAYAALYPPIRTLAHIEQQVVGVLEQLYGWLGGVGSAISKGASSLVDGLQQGSPGYAKEVINSIYESKGLPPPYPDQSSGSGSSRHG